MKLLQRAFWTILILSITYAVALPESTGCGTAWLSINIAATDATTHQPIPAVITTLVSERRTKYPQMRSAPPTILVAQTDERGHAILKDSFGAGFGNWHTSIYTGNTTVRCEAVGYSPTEVKVAPASRLSFRDFLIYKQPNTVSIAVDLKRQ